MSAQQLYQVAGPLIERGLVTLDIRGLYMTDEGRAGTYTIERQTK